MPGIVGAELVVLCIRSNWMGSHILQTECHQIMDYKVCLDLWARACACEQNKTSTHTHFAPLFIREVTWPETELPLVVALDCGVESVDLYYICNYSLFRLVGMCMCVRAR